VVDRFGYCNSVLIESFKENGKKQKHEIKYSSLAKGVEDLGEGKGP